MFSISSAFTLNREANKGFTLIEVLIVITIMGLFMGIGFANFRGFARRQKAENYARIVEADLRMAQELSLSGRKPQFRTDGVTPFCVSDTALEGREEMIGIQFEYTGATYHFFGLCQNTEDDPITQSASAPIKTVAIPAGITINIDSTTSPANSVIFNTLGRGTNLDPAGFTISICTEESSEGLLVSQEGRIAPAPPNCP